MSANANGAESEVRHQHHHGQAEADPVGVVDPVCGMTVSPPTKAGSVEHEGTTYHFCSKGCREKFEAAPEKYLTKDKHADPHLPYPQSGASSPQSPCAGSR